MLMSFTNSLAIANQLPVFLCANVLPFFHVPTE